MLSSTKKRYMLAIYQLGSDGREVRSKDIANAINVKRPTVSKILKTLADDNLIEKEDYSTILFTENGTRIANKIFTQYLLFYHYYINELNMESETAKYNAVVSVCGFSDEGITAFTEHILKSQNNNK